MVTQTSFWTYKLFYWINLKGLCESVIISKKKKRVCVLKKIFVYLFLNIKKETSLFISLFMKTKGSL